MEKNKLWFFFLMFLERKVANYWHGTITRKPKKRFTEAMSSRYVTKQTRLQLSPLHACHTRHTCLQTARTCTWEDKPLNGPTWALLHGIYLKAFLLVFLLNASECQKKLVNENRAQCVTIIGRRLQTAPEVVLGATAMQCHYFSKVMQCKAGFW